MSVTFDPVCDQAIALAKSALPDGSPLGVEQLLAALYHVSDLKDHWPQLAPYLPAPQPGPSKRDKVPVADALKPILNQLAGAAQPVTADRLFAALIGSDAGRRYLTGRGLAEAEVRALAANLGAPSRWRGSAERDRAIRALDSFGRMLTLGTPAAGGTAEMDGALQAVIRVLCKMRRRNAILVGPPGTGKTAAIHELARRFVQGHPSIPPRLREHDLFELAPAFLRSGVTYVGQYEERVKTLIQTLRDNPRIILFVDEIHLFLGGSPQDQGPFAAAHEAFREALRRSEITCLGCTTPAEYRALMAPDKGLEQLFHLVPVEPPSREATLRMLQERRPRMETYFAPLRIPDAALARVVDLSEEYLPARYQPEKSVQLLDEACAVCATLQPPAAQVEEVHLLQALEDLLGHRLVRHGRLTEAEVFQKLREAIVGQDAVLQSVAEKFVAGLGGWQRQSGPRGVFLFGGPTGVGKTETAVLLARLLGDGRESLVRVDGNALQGSGAGWESQSLTWQLLGAPPGYVGYARGQAGLLGRIRDLPESIVLFDEFEKADPALGRLLLRVLDEGRAEDLEGNLLDFRRAFLIFTTNAGCSYDRLGFGFGKPGQPADDRPTVDPDALRDHLRAIGLGEEFLARIPHWFMFQALDDASIREVIRRQLEALRQLLAARGLQLNWDAELAEHLAARWQPRFGVRHLTTILRNRILEQLSVADAQGELQGVTAVRLQPLRTGPDGLPGDLTGAATRQREGQTLVIHLA